MLATLMGAHLLLLRTGAQECDEFHRTLSARLAKVPLGSPDALRLIDEWKGYLNGKQQECAQQEEAFAGAAQLYTGIILSLLTGAGMACGTAYGVETGRYLPVPSSKNDADKEDTP